MYNLLLVTVQGDPAPGLLRALEEERIAFTIVSDIKALSISEAAETVDAVVVDLNTHDRDAALPVVDWCRELKVPLLYAVPAHIVAEYDDSWGASDFFVIPPYPGEVTARIRQVRQRDHVEPSATEAGNVLQVGALRIDVDRYEVFNRGRKVLLTFKEYKLLYTLASNPGRVFSRETLLNQIWEYDYYGGTRTVDVHIRRLRSKIEDLGDTYIETVWNVGYRFRPGAPSGEA